MSGVSAAAEAASLIEKETSSGLNIFNMLPFLSQRSQRFFDFSLRTLWAL